MHPELAAEGRRLQLEMALLARRVNAVGRPLTEQEEQEVVRESADLRQRIADWMTRRTIGDRPEVVSHGRPTSHAAAKRGLENARGVLGDRSSFKRGRPTCPAANRLGGGAVLCGVERSVLRPHEDPMSLATFCYGDHTACPSWRAERERRTAAPLVA